MKMKRFENFLDYFKVICKKCGSEDIYLSILNCDECSDTIEGECNSCKSKYKYHDFKQGIAEYDEQGKEITFIKE